LKENASSEEHLDQYWIHFKDNLAKDEAVKKAAIERRDYSEDTINQLYQITATKEFAKLLTLKKSDPIAYHLAYWLATVVKCAKNMCCVCYQEYK
jgi:hypothetical protein